MSHSVIQDHEFGDIVCKRTRGRYVRLRVSEHGDITATLPKRAALRHVQELLEKSRLQLRELRDTQLAKRVVYCDGMTIGHSHTLSLTGTSDTTASKRIHGQILALQIPLQWDANTGEGRAFIASQVKAVLRREAQAYLPRRLACLADRHGFHYQTVRFGNPRGRWGSCSSRGTISLNVALMNAPLDVIDYVLIHELAHTQHMNHSPAFWGTVERCFPAYKAARAHLKLMSPIC